MICAGLPRVGARLLKTLNQIGRNIMAKATKTSWNVEWKKDASGNYYVCPSKSGSKSGSFDYCVDYSISGVPLGD